MYTIDREGVKRLFDNEVKTNFKAYLKHYLYELGDSYVKRTNSDDLSFSFKVSYPMIHIESQFKFELSFYCYVKPIDVEVNLDMDIEATFKKSEHLVEVSEIYQYFQAIDKNYYLQTLKRLKEG